MEQSRWCGATVEGESVTWHELLDVRYGAEGEVNSEEIAAFGSNNWKFYWTSLSFSCSLRESSDIYISEQNMIMYLNEVYKLCTIGLK